MVWKVYSITYDPFHNNSDTYAAVLDNAIFFFIVSYSFLVAMDILSYSGSGIPNHVCAMLVNASFHLWVLIYQVKKLGLYGV